MATHVVVVHGINAFGNVGPLACKLHRGAFMIPQSRI